jgi:Fe-S oxidoreductase
MRALPTLEKQRAALEKCVFCPKLCRSACPVSNAEPRETITPWGKMSMAYFAAHGDVPADTSHAAPAWACTGCGACRQACDHKNDVATTLLDARAALLSAGVAPEAAARIAEGFERHREEARDAVRALAAAGVRAPGGARAPDGVRAATVRERPTGTALLVGCAYVRGAPEEARDAVFVAAALAGGEVSLVDECCGLPLLLAGAADAFARHAAGVARSLAGASSVLVADAGCAHALRVRYPAAGAPVAPRVQHIVERAAEKLGDLPAGAPGGGRLRWHDPCQLGRGLGVYDAPRAVLARTAGRAPDEFFGCRDYAACSGGGGLLPATMPETAAGIAGARIAEHEAAGGGRVVTGCASSLASLRRAAKGRYEVDDIVTHLARALAR